MKRSITEIGMVRLPASSARLFQLWLTLLGRLASWLDVVGSTNVDGARKASTEWYPHASRVEPAANIFDGTLYQPHADGSIAWDSLIVSPSLRAEFPRENLDNHYYAARMTSSTPLRVKTPPASNKRSFFSTAAYPLFPSPLSAKPTTAGKLLVESRSEDEIPNTILWERRGEQVGYRIGGALPKDVVLGVPELTATIDDLGRDVEGMLVFQGLYQDEAHAMLETWRGSWFEEGSRLLYIVPTAFVDGVLPLSINPAPSQTVRVFVGRLEIVTRATEKAVEGALPTHDRATLKMYGRFLEPILATMIQEESNPARLQQYYQALNSYFSSEVAHNRRRD